MSDKLFKVVVVALLLLILGAVVGNYSAEYFSESEEFVEFEEDLHLFEEEMIQYRYNVYTFEEFELINGISLEEEEDVFHFAERYGYELFEEDDIIELFFSYECGEDDLGRFVCLEETLTFLLDEELVEHRWEGFLYEDE